MHTTEQPLDYAQAAQLADEARQRLSEGTPASNLLDRLVNGLRLSAEAEKAAVESGTLAGDAIARVITHAQDKRDAMLRAWEQKAGNRSAAVAAVPDGSMASLDDLLRSHFEALYQRLDDNLDR